MEEQLTDFKTGPFTAQGLLGMSLQGYKYISAAVAICCFILLFWPEDTIFNTIFIVLQNQRYTVEMLQPADKKQRKSVQTALKQRT